MAFPYEGWVNIYARGRILGNVTDFYTPKPKHALMLKEKSAKTNVAEHQVLYQQGEQIHADNDILDNDILVQCDAHNR
jgi:hypothetical protein